jgi:hypothetical protein
MVRLTDKMSRLSSFVRAGKMHVKDESFKDTCIDVINYMILLAAYINSKDQEQKKKELLVENNKNIIDLNTNKPL